MISFDIHYFAEVIKFPRFILATNIFKNNIYNYNKSFIFIILVLYL